MFHAKDAHYAYGINAAILVFPKDFGSDRYYLMV